MSRQTTSMTWNGVSAGQRVVMLIETKGMTADDEEIAYPAGTFASIADIADFGAYQGEGVNVVIGEGCRAICNSFDDRDVMQLGSLPFRCV